MLSGQCHPLAGDSAAAIFASAFTLELGHALVAEGAVIDRQLFAPLDVP